MPQYFIRTKVALQPLSEPYKQLSPVLCCEFYVDLTADERSVSFYLEPEEEDGYLRDACVFSEEIDIYDTMSVNVKYRNGILLSYSLEDEL